MAEPMISRRHLPTIAGGVGGGILATAPTAAVFSIGFLAGPPAWIIGGAIMLGGMYLGATNLGPKIDQHLKENGVELSSTTTGDGARVADGQKVGRSAQADVAQAAATDTLAPNLTIDARTVEPRQLG